MTMYIALALAAIVAAALLIFYAFMARSAQLLDMKEAGKLEDKITGSLLGLTPVATGTMAVGGSAIVGFLYLIFRIANH